MNFQEHKTMLAALEAGAATPDQQRAAFAHLQAVKRQHSQEMREEQREAQREAQAAYIEGRWDAAAEQRGEPYGTY